eukprot:TRINITY_DN7892_c0_g2_i1.p1 TRINITY_DN7892_c0_g2~~TRINITY_DN7892_c0_g2_i1.p1  ORF type:complete len:519 (+),score=75.54 TRINITY_DN7892_c0_g2_i1:77-1558(+)
MTPNRHSSMESITTFNGVDGHSIDPFAFGYHDAGVNGWDAAGLPLLPYVEEPTTPAIFWPVPVACFDDTVAVAAAEASPQSPVFAAGSPMAAIPLAGMRTADSLVNYPDLTEESPPVARRRRRAHRRTGTLRRERMGRDQFVDVSLQTNAAGNGQQHSSFSWSNPADPRCPSELVESPARCVALSEKLKAANHSDKAELHRVIEWLLPVVHKLSLESHGCRLVQDAIIASTAPTQCLLLGKLEPHLQELSESPCGNHVLSRLIEYMPSAAIGPVVSWLEGRTPNGSSRVSVVVRNRFGCRAIERMIEHCSERQLGVILDEVVADAVPLCRHPFGNLVVGHILEHGSHVMKHKILEHLMPVLGMLSMHRTGSFVVQKAFRFCSEQVQESMVALLLDLPRPESLLDVATSRYGSFVVEQIITESYAPSISAVRQYFLEHFLVLVQTTHGCRVAVRCGFLGSSDTTASVVPADGPHEGTSTRVPSSASGFDSESDV